MKSLIFDHNKGIWWQAWKKFTLVNLYPSLNSYITQYTFNLARDEDGKLTMEELRQARELIKMSNLTNMILNHHCHHYQSQVMTSMGEEPVSEEEFQAFAKVVI